ncbi:hypothetical protein BRADI_4g13787v3 [Brachypodium distachyon]|uniref:Uncharacterized protein n=1 Tax=Brachypodium distachyon TaxID=15368 RepID=A0A2K2CMM4_BRADI|nr:hypothetical protein BRADI_4g13787v3 [Brachypodium distachyon]
MNPQALLRLLHALTGTQDEEFEEAMYHNVLTKLRLKSGFHRHRKRAGHLCLLEGELHNLDTTNEPEAPIFDKTPQCITNFFINFAENGSDKKIAAGRT